MSEFVAVTFFDGLAQFDTTIYHAMEAPHHTIVMQLNAVQHPDPTSPLVFHRSAFRRLQHLVCAPGS